ncbi:hypothetical protein QCA50_004387 [Cerrena zonata]|uniref:Transmembrane protein n=1 Tax=Cerrena zonata TaxID=2478898 RepID=A0AAW0GTF6_9APHY
MNTIVLQYTPHEYPPTDVPWELRSYYTKEVWEKRLPAITRKASRYYKRHFSTLWLCLLIACSIAVPIGMFYVALDHLPKSQEEKDFEEKEKDHFFFYWHGGFDRYWKARLIAFASWVIVMVLFYTPMLMWKSHGKKQVNKQLDKWEKEDRASRSGSNDVPVFKILRIGIFGSTIRLQVRLPSSYIPVSSFHPAANLPAYLINGAPDSGMTAFYYGHQVPLSAPVYPQGPITQYPTAPITGLSGIPLYNEKDEKVSKQKSTENFEEVKV